MLFIVITIILGVGGDKRYSRKNIRVLKILSENLSSVVRERSNFFRYETQKKNYKIL